MKEASKEDECPPVVVGCGPGEEGSGRRGGREPCRRPYLLGALGANRRLQVVQGWLSRTARAPSQPCWVLTSPIASRLPQSPTPSSSPSRCGEAGVDWESRPASRAFHNHRTPAPAPIRDCHSSAPRPPARPLATQRPICQQSRHLTGRLRAGSGGSKRKRLCLTLWPEDDSMQRMLMDKHRCASERASSRRAIELLEDAVEDHSD